MVRIWEDIEEENTLNVGVRPWTKEQIFICPSIHLFTPDITNLQYDSQNSKQENISVNKIDCPHGTLYSVGEIQHMSS